MASTFNSVQEVGLVETNFNRVSKTIELATSHAMLPPPFNMIVIALTAFHSEVAVPVVTSEEELNVIASVDPDSIDPESKSLNNHTAIHIPLKQNDKNSSLLLHEDTKSELKETPTAVQDVDETSLSLFFFFKKKKICFDLFTLLIDFNDKKRSLFVPLQQTTIMDSPFDQKFAVYCQYCRHDTDSATGDINDYFELFRQYQMIDEADKALMKKLLYRQTICPNCFRPYTTESRFFRWQVIMEILSFYVFMIFIWFPLIIFLLIPALLDRIWISVKSLRISQGQGNELLTRPDIDMDHTDLEYKDTVREIIKNAKASENGANTATANETNASREETEDVMLGPNEIDEMIQEMQANFLFIKLTLLAKKTNQFFCTKTEICVKNDDIRQKKEINKRKKYISTAQIHNETYTTQEHIPIDLDEFLVEQNIYPHFTNLPLTKSVEVQADEVVPRPVTPPKVKGKTGLDMGIQVNSDELFDINTEIQPIVDVIADNVLTQSIFEVKQEILLQNLQRHKVDKIIRKINFIIENLMIKEKIRQDKITDILLSEEEKFAAHKLLIEKKIKEREKKTKLKEKLLVIGLAQVLSFNLMDDVLQSLEQCNITTKQEKKEINEILVPPLTQNTSQNISLAQISHVVLNEMIQSATFQILFEDKESTETTQSGFEDYEKSECE
ncbi:Radial spoke protein 3 containing protein [Reticulomyxa filosa]|uniref:Radial spoke protein 3 containing protein n=1 Tax=Reticulomyxa filosa TaxID=46433 RepID=X6N8U1_RETFI|nr:Radial spoke protein 3 containing protein [Reticulomyxa filosa]|eukprot:ETO22318.1 Radial spoke protein 3 containing protein [Reticulomyxa filosa]